MRKIEENMINALDNETQVNLGNTVVYTNKVELYGNKIIEVHHDSVSISTCGFNSNTTMSRLRAFLSVYVPYIELKTKGGKLVITDKSTDEKTIWDGSTKHFDFY